ncbi:hypothetical protein QUA54_00435 [Microcoleus sp. MOSTC5]|uniref:hypothetical protein n=1 Tax=Microcoleus sp. MOSTC5 TaxID=3055378 RepID=UPI002FD39350
MSVVAGRVQKNRFLMLAFLGDVNPEAAAHSKKLSADRLLKVATYAKDIEKPGFSLKLLD